jgi:glutamine amidotransferase
VIAVVDYGMGNLGNVCRAIKHCGSRAKICATSESLRKAKKIILPGVGAFPDAVKELKRKGLWNTLISEAKKGKPLMGICLGYQLLFSSSDEGGRKIKGLDLVSGDVKRFSPAKCRKKGLKVPHMGWNQLTLKKKCSVLKGVKDKSYFYFVHSFYPAPKNKRDILGTTHHGQEYAAAVSRDNIIGFQFHPEKSQDAGLRILKNFVNS